MSRQILVAEGVSRWFAAGGERVVAVREASFQVEEGEIVVVRVLTMEDGVLRDHVGVG